MQKLNDKPFTMAFSDFQNVTLSSSDGKYVVSCIKMCQSTRNETVQG